MDTLLLALTVVSLVSVVAFGFVVYQVLKAVYVYLDIMFDGDSSRPLLFKLPPRVVSVLLVLCFVALVL